MMTKFHFECLPTKSLPNQLVAHTDAKHRNLPNYFLYCLHSIGDCSWISRTIAKKNTIRLQLKYLRSRPIRWNNSYLASIWCQAPQNIMFDPKIISNDLYNKRKPTSGGRYILDVQKNRHRKRESANTDMKSCTRLIFIEGPFWIGFVWPFIWSITCDTTNQINSWTILTQKLLPLQPRDNSINIVQRSFSAV